jgi:hypothetical protein
LPAALRGAVTGKTKPRRQRMRRKYFISGRILLPSSNVLGEDAMLSDRAGCMEKMMKQTLIRYKTKPELADKNAELIAGVFAELQAARPEGTRYLSLRLEDDTFIHFVETTAADGNSALPKLAAFQEFQSGIRERCSEPPVARGVTIVGNYRMLGEP